MAAGTSAWFVLDLFIITFISISLHLLSRALIQQMSQRFRLYHGQTHHPISHIPELFFQFTTGFPEHSYMCTSWSFVQLVLCEMSFSLHHLALCWTVARGYQRSTLHICTGTLPVLLCAKNFLLYIMIHNNIIPIYL